MRYFFTLMVLFVLTFPVFADGGWEQVAGIKEPHVRKIVCGKDILYAASEKRLYRSEDRGETWAIVFMARGSGNAINSVALFRRGVFVCTANGLFKSIDGKLDWKQVFRGRGEDEKSVLCVAFSDDTIYIGTKAGLYVTPSDKIAWEKQRGIIGDIIIKRIVFHEGRILALSQRGVYRNNASGWERVYVIKEDSENCESEPDEGDETCDDIVTDIFSDGRNLFLASEKGIFTSEDCGDSWIKFESSGLFSEEISRFLFKDSLYAATDKGVFIFSEEKRKWRLLDVGSAGFKVNDISTDAAGRVWAACDNGLYMFESSETAGSITMAGDFSHEPGIGEVREVAIEYAEVSPEKIKGWRRRAGLKALLPEVSLDYDKTVNYDSGADRYYVGPYDWGASVKWDLGEIIWNDDQTSIDVRSKLMVQLRGDILDEVTNIYFERRRLQINTLSLSSPDTKEKTEQDLRIQELTADLDALTGGYFSSNITPD